MAADIQKLLSHRLRGFSSVEHSPSAMSAACRSDVPFLELDTRASRDGEIFVFHDPSTGSLTDRALDFAQATSRELLQLRYANGERLLRLDEALACFKERRNREQTLCIDIKDFGFEEAHLRLVDACGLSDRVCYVSWMPQCLLRLAELGVRSPLFFSCVSLLKFGFPGRVIAGALRNRRFRFGHLVLLGAAQAQHPLDHLSHGFQHGFFCQELPVNLTHAIASSGGGICIHKSLLGERLYTYCSRNNLNIWTFSVRGIHAFLQYARQPNVRVVFCDDAPEVARAIGIT